LLQCPLLADSVEEVAARTTRGIFGLRALALVK
jgi:hypothetical protein